MHSRPLWILFAITAAIAGVLSYFAWSRPDALEHALSNYRNGSVNTAPQAPGQSAAAAKTPLPGYTVPSVTHPFAGNAVAGIIGVAATFAVLVAIVWILKPRGRAQLGDKQDG
jgi:hypothetical protein